jgi:hypothetical protein
MKRKEQIMVIRDSNEIRLLERINRLVRAGFRARVTILAGPSSCATIEKETRRP